MALFTSTVNYSITTPEGTKAFQRSYSTETFQPLKVTLTASQANRQVNLAIPIARLKALHIKSPVHIDIYTNAASGGAPDDNIDIPAGGGLSWDVDSGFACPLTVDVTDLYITNNDAVAVTATDPVEITIVLDPTP